MFANALTQHHTARRLPAAVALGRCMNPCQIQQAKLRNANGLNVAAPSGAAVG